MQVIVDTNVVLAYLISGSSRSSNAKVCGRVVSGIDTAFTCDILYGEMKRLLELDPDLIEKISTAGKKEGEVFRAIESVKTEYLKSRLDPYVMQLNFVKTENLSVEPNAIREIGNDWYIISIAKTVKIDYIVTWNKVDILKHAEGNGLHAHQILEPPQYLELLKQEARTE